MWFASLAATNAGGTDWLAASQDTTPHSPCKPRMEPSTQNAEDRVYFKDYTEKGENTMKIVNADYEILTHIDGQEELKLIEKIGRTCYKSENKITDNSAEKFVRMLIKNKHEAMLEHSMLSVKFIVDRGVTHELVRHRLSAFAQESTRYCRYCDERFVNELTFIKPCFFGNSSHEFYIWEHQCKLSEIAYFVLLCDGATPEQARSVLPMSIKSEIVVTANYREWRHILNLRAAGTTGKPHPQMLEVMIPLLEELKAKIPVVFDDIDVM